MIPPEFKSPINLPKPDGPKCDENGVCSVPLTDAVVDQFLDSSPPPDPEKVARIREKFEEKMSNEQHEKRDTDGAANIQLLAWAVSNCYTLARRRLNAQSPDAEWWQHVLRICEKAGAQSPGVLRASLPTEITDGGHPTSNPRARIIESAEQVYENVDAETDQQARQAGHLQAASTALVIAKERIDAADTPESELYEGRIQALEVIDALLADLQKEGPP